MDLWCRGSDAAEDVVSAALVGIELEVGTPASTTPASSKTSLARTSPTSLARTRKSRPT